MQIIKSKTLREVEPHTKYMGCTFYLEGPHCLDDCVFDNCSFRGDLHYVDSFNYEPGASYPEMKNCSFPERVINEYCAGNVISDFFCAEEILLNNTTTLIVKPVSDTTRAVTIHARMPKIKTIDLSAYESYSETPVDWFKRFPTLERVILPKDIPDTFSGPGYLIMQERYNVFDNESGSVHYDWKPKRLVLLGYELVRVNHFPPIQYTP